MALLDAAALSLALRGHKDLHSALQSYARARKKHVALFQALSRMFTPFYQSDSRLLSFARDRLVATVAKMPPAPLLLASIVSGTLLDPLGEGGVDGTGLASH